MKHLTLFLLLLTISMSAQMRQFPLLEPVSNHIPESFIIEGGENELVMIWIDSTDLHVSKSLDDGGTWKTPTTLVDNTILRDSLSDLNALKINNGRILVTYKFKFHYLIYSDDNGSTWSEPTQLITDVGIIRPRKIMESSLSQTSDNKIWFVYNRLGTIYNIQSDDGNKWSEKDTLVVIEDGVPHFSSVNSTWDNSLVLYYEKRNDDTSDIYEMTSIDSGKTWSGPNIILDNGINKLRPRVIKDANKTLWITYTQVEPTPFEEYYQSNIYYSKLLDGENSWSTLTKFTQYVGFDGKQNISFANNKLFISFTSDRWRGQTIWYGVVETNDSETSPAIFGTDIQYQNDYPKVNIFITAKVYDTERIDSVLFHFYEGSEEGQFIQLFDDGFHNDAEAGDYIYGNMIVGLNNGFKLNIFYSAVDQYGNRNLTDVSSIESSYAADGGETFAFDNNNFKFSINSDGTIGVRKPSPRDGVECLFDNETIIYSSGFALSGYTAGKLWANGIMGTTHFKDYIHGPIDSIESLNKIHVLRSSQPDFYQSWIDWKDAVRDGADFYDGNSDGLYNPVDLNENGIWDINEDKPDILGDITAFTAFTVFNDGVESQDRNFSNVEPQGIEIKQTAFSYNKETSSKLSNVIFIRYEIENMGTVADKLDSVYFGAWADIDLGSYIDDLVGVDSTQNSIYCYNDGVDSDFFASVNYGANPPAIFVSFVQGPPIYIAGETYSDENGNGIFDPKIDTPIKTAVNRKGELLGIEEYPGAKNNGITAGLHYLSGNIYLDDWDDENILRNYMLGYNMFGNLIKPCTWNFGEVFVDDCISVNPRLMYSGDPVSQNGWINTKPFDQRQLGSTGPFSLIKGKPIEMIVAYIIGRGTDALNSITEARRITNDVIGFYNTNFSYVPVGVRENPQTQLPTEYSLSQNYPNPFNPSTTIRYSIPDNEVIASGAKQSHKIATSSDEAWTPRNDNLNVTLKIYDILGREVITLVNKQQKAGSYEVEFNASHLTSGIYFYRLQSANYIETKKLMLIK